MLRSHRTGQTDSPRKTSPFLVLVFGVVVAIVLMVKSLSSLEAQTVSPLTVQPTTGRVGIGTTTPGATLDATGSDVIGVRYLKLGSKDSRITVGDPGKSWSLAVGWATQGDLSVIEEGVAGDRLYVKQGGNVGIGTAAPLYKLDVAGQIRATAGTPMYTPAQACGGGGGVTTVATCTTPACAWGGTPDNPFPNTWLNCSGACSVSGGPATCNNVLLGRLVAP